MSRAPFIALLSPLALLACSPLEPTVPASPAVASVTASAPAPPRPAPLPEVSLQIELDDDFVRPIWPSFVRAPLLVESVSPELSPASKKRLVTVLDQLRAADEAAAKGEAADPKKAKRRAAALSSAADALLAEATKSDKAGAWLSTAYLFDRLMSLPDGERPEPGLLVQMRAKAADAFARATAATEVSSPLGKQAREHASAFLFARGIGDRGKADLLALVDAGAPPAETLYRLGYLLSMGEQAKPDQAEALFRRGIDDPREASGELKLALAHGVMLSAYRQGKFDEALRTAMKILWVLPPLDPPTILSDGAMRLGADCVEQLGGVAALDRLGGAPPQPEILLRVAWRAVRRGDLAGALDAAKVVLSRWPLDWRAPQAQKIVIAVADRRGDAAAAEDARKHLVDDYGPASLWAEEQRKRRDSLGRPSDQALHDAALPPAPPKAEDDQMNLEGRVKTLVRLCLEPDWWRVPTPMRAGEEGVALSVSAKVVPGERPTVEARVVAGEVKLDRVLSCVAKQGPSHLEGAPASVSVRVRY